jgi:hypothetical protein
MFITDCTIASILPRRCATVIMNPTAAVVSAVAGSACASADLAHDPEERERIDRAGDQVVVGVLAVVDGSCRAASASRAVCSTLSLGVMAVSTSTCACGPSRRQTSAGAPVSRSVL